MATVSERSLNDLIDETDEWGGVEWWRLELRSFFEAPYVQRALVVLGPKEAMRAEYRRSSGASCLQALAYIFLLIAPLVGAVSMLVWIINSGDFDFPLAFAGTLTLISFLATGWSEIQRTRHPRAVSPSALRTTTFMHVVPGIVTALIALTAGREMLNGGAWGWIAVVLADVVVYAAIYVRGAKSTNGPQNSHDNVDQSIRELGEVAAVQIRVARDAAIDRLVKLGRIDAVAGDRARHAKLGHLGLTMAPEARSGYYR